MATFKSSKITSGAPARAGNDITSNSVVLAVSEWVLNDLYQLILVPVGATILDVIFSANQLDTNGSATAKVDVGDATVSNRFIGASSIVQGGGSIRTTTGNIPYTVTGGDLIIQAKAQTAAATFNAGNIGLTVVYTMQQ